MGFQESLSYLKRIHITIQISFDIQFRPYIKNYNRQVQLYDKK
jgi:hypothetical protein